MAEALYKRIPFEEAISDTRLLQPAFSKLSPPQQSALKIFYGLPLDQTGLRHYSMFMGRGTYDELGYPLDVPVADDYQPFEYEEGVAVFGRRSAKTSNWLAFIVVYEALLGGHTQWANPKQQVVSFVVAQMLDVAQAIIRDFVEPLIASSPILEKEIVKSNADGISLKNGHRIAPAPPAIKNFRYFAIPVVVMDEAAFWYKDAESANPDFEVLRAVSPAQAQFPYRKRAIASTVWSKEGIIWEALQAGNHASKVPADDEELLEKYRHTLVMTAPTPAMENPLLKRNWFQREYKKDPQAYEREILNKAADMISGMFSEILMKWATEGQPMVARAFNPDFNYTAAIDPAFRTDDFTFSIWHYEPTQGLVQDFVKNWKPEAKTKLNPSPILDEVKQDLKTYGLDMVWSDQYQLESLQQLALDRDFTIMGEDLTGKSKVKMFGSFLQSLRNRRVKLLRHRDQFQQFTSIQKIMGSGGNVRISAPIGKHDDFVTVDVLAASKALQYGFTEKVAAPKEPTPYERNMAKIQAAIEQEQNSDGWL